LGDEGGELVEEGHFCIRGCEVKSGGLEMEMVFVVVCAGRVEEIV
jgi:hypothetical protein